MTHQRVERGHHEVAHAGGPGEPVGLLGRGGSEEGGGPRVARNVPGRLREGRGEDRALGVEEDEVPELRVRGIDGADGETFGAHLHAGPCVAGNGAAALGHYNTDVIAGVVPAEVSEETEVWLDLTVDDGAGTATASVPFVPLPGERSVVVHALATDHHTGAAGPRLACLPVVW